MKTLNQLTPIAADTASGIYLVDHQDHIDADWLLFDYFHDSLSDLADDRVIYCAVTPAELEALKAEYGVH